MAVPLTETPPRPATVGAVRRFQAASRRGPGRGQRIQGIYIAVVVTLIAGTLVYNAAHSALAQVIGQGEVGRWGPSLVLLVLLAAGHWGTVQGPVVFSVADVGHLVLGSPLPRRALVAAPLVRALAAAALTGAVAAGVVAVGLSGRGHTMGAARVVDLVAGIALVGILAAVVAFAVSTHRRCEHALRALTGPVLIAAAALALAGALAGSDRPRRSTRGRARGDGRSRRAQARARHGTSRPPPGSPLWSSSPPRSSGAGAGAGGGALRAPLRRGTPGCRHH